MPNREIVYYGWARHENGLYGLLRVTRRGGRQVSQEWTGLFMADERALAKECERLNGGVR